MSSEMIKTEDITYHCRTQVHQHKLSYIWSINDFLKIYRFLDTIYFHENTKYLKIYATFVENSVKFFALLNENDIQDNIEHIPVGYSVSFNTIKGEIWHISKNKWFTRTENELLYELFNLHLEDNKQKYLLNGTLTVCFRFIIWDGLVNYNLCHSFNSKIITQSFVPDKISDSLVTFIIDEKRLQANKALLCSKSKVFEAMFNCGLKESNVNEVEIIDIKYDILRQLLLFLQSGYLSENVRTDTKVASELLVAAEKYDLIDLKLICEEYLIINTTKVNVVKHLQLAILNNATTLKKFALSLIKLHLSDIMNTPNFITLIEEYQELLPQIQVVEISSCNKLSNYKY